MAERNGHAAGELGARIGALRVHAGWSQPELAARAGVSKATISKLEAGKTAEPDAKTKRGLVRALGWSDYETMVGSAELEPAAPTRDDLLTEMFNLLLGVRRDVRALLERTQNGQPAPK